MWPSPNSHRPCQCGTGADGFGSPRNWCWRRQGWHLRCCRHPNGNVGITLMEFKSHGIMAFSDPSRSNYTDPGTSNASWVDEVGSCACQHFQHFALKPGRTEPESGKEPPLEHGSKHVKTCQNMSKHVKTSDCTYLGRWTSGFTSHFNAT